jgi:hypothetical protein
MQDIVAGLMPAEESVSRSDLGNHHFPVLDILCSKLRVSVMELLEGSCRTATQVLLLQVMQDLNLVLAVFTAPASSSAGIFWIFFTGN